MLFQQQHNASHILLIYFIMVFKCDPCHCKAIWVLVCDGFYKTLLAMSYLCNCRFEDASHFSLTAHVNMPSSPPFTSKGSCLANASRRYKMQNVESTLVIAPCLCLLPADQTKLATPSGLCWASGRSSKAWIKGWMICVLEKNAKLPSHRPLDLEKKAKVRIT